MDAGLREVKEALGLGCGVLWVHWDLHAFRVSKARSRIAGIRTRDGRGGAGTRAHSSLGKMGSKVAKARMRVWETDLGRP